MLDKILQTLMFKKNVKPSQVARETNIPKQTLSRMISGKSPNPHHKNLEPLADYFNVSVGQLKGKEQLPTDAVDITLPNSKPKAKSIPLRNWNELNNIKDENSKEEIFVSHNLSDHSFAVPMLDTSMEPLFRKGSVLILDPNKNYSDRSFLLVKLASVEQVIFRQLLIDAEHHYLKALSPDFDAFPMRLLDEEDKIIGTLVEARQIF